VLEYTGIRVRDLDRSRRFYTDGLGLRSVRRGRMAAGGEWEELEDPESHAMLELNHYPGAPPYREGDELDHLGFRVLDLEGSVHRLLALGAKLRIPPFLEGEQRLAFLSDPDGVWLELYETAGPDGAPSSLAAD
jgi:catechol 2,3-dioxygenase-like lactoylglutathione lyase family enzyme